MTQERKAKAEQIIEDLIYLKDFLKKYSGETPYNFEKIINSTCNFLEEMTQEGGNLCG